MGVREFYGGDLQGVMNKLDYLLKKGKTYYVRVRAFSKDSNGKQICTAWSTAKKVTIKKEGVKILVSMESKSF